MLQKLILSTLIPLLLSFMGCASIPNIEDAVKTGDTEAVKKLLDKGADVNTKTENGVTLLFIASQEGHDNIVKILLDKGADVNTKTETGMTALYVASFKGYTNIVKTLLASGADVDAETLNGSTALTVAKNEEIIQLLKGNEKEPESYILTCEEDCVQMLKRGELKEGITVENCIEILCNIVE